MASRLVSQCQWSNVRPAATERDGDSVSDGAGDDDGDGRQLTVDSDSDETGVFDRSEDSGRRQTADGRPRRRRMKEMGRGWIVVGRRKAGGRTAEGCREVASRCVALRCVARRCCCCC